VNCLRHFWWYAQKVFDLPRRLARVRDRRSQSEIPTRAVTWTLFLGGLLRISSRLGLEIKSRKKGWQRLIGHAKPISDDALGYVLERYDLEDLRTVLVEVNRDLKRNKALESCKIDGLLVVALDGNEQFNSRCRCCEQCCERKIQIKDAQGKTTKVREFYHRHIYAHITGPKFTAILDVEAIRPGEEECQAALRLLERIRNLYGVRFFDVVTVDSWYAKGPFIKAVRQLGWSVVCVLKQSRYEIYQEASRLSTRQNAQSWETEDHRQIQAWDVKNLPFTDEALDNMRVVITQECWQERQQVAGEYVRVDKTGHWRWLVDASLEGSGVRTIWKIGHSRWGVENHAFNELTQYDHLTHCTRHEPTAMLAWLLLRVLALNLFDCFARLHGKLWRQGRVTLKSIAEDLLGAMERFEELEPLWSD
jgi:Transposase DDE domain